jgi:hypothetical protein
MSHEGISVRHATCDLMWMGMAERISTPRTGLRIQERRRQWKSQSISSGKRKLRPDMYPVAAEHRVQPTSEIRPI